MKLLENIGQGIDAVKSNLLRAFITCLIIAIGISALVGILTSIDAMNFAITKTFSRMGSQSFNIRNTQGVQRHGGPISAAQADAISYIQASRFKRDFQFPSDVSISRNAAMTAKVKHEGQETNPNVRVIGVDENYLKTASYDIAQGRNFTSNDVELALPLAIVGKEIVSSVIPDANAVGKEILVNGKRYRIVGELAEKGSSLGMSGGDRVVFVPVSRSRQDFVDGRENFFINVAVDEVSQLDPAMNEAYLMMRKSGVPDCREQIILY